jgi:fatty-acyl-CoA synthase
MSHPAVAEAAVIGVGHPKWGEVALACVVKAEGAEVTEDEIITHLAGKIAKWQLPKGVVWIDEVPKTSVGKFSKKTLREEYALHLMGESEG